MIKYKRNKKKELLHKKNKRIESNNSAKSSSGNGFYYSFLTVVLLLCLFQITVSAVLNISKIVSYKSKIVQITKTRDAAMATNEQLKDSIKNFSNVAGLEEIARNNLKMSGEDEVLVIINSPKSEEISDEKPKTFGFFKHDWVFIH